MPLCFEFSFIDPLTETNPGGQLEKKKKITLGNEGEKKKVFHERLNTGVQLKYMKNQT